MAESKLTIIKCFFCKAEIAVVDEDLKARAMHARTLQVVGGDALYCCLKCGAAQILDRERR